MKIGFEEREELSGDGALEATHDLLGGLALLGAPLGVDEGTGIVAQAGQGDDPQGVVGLAVPAAVEAVADGLARGRLHGAGAAQRGQGGVGAEPVGVVSGGDQQAAGGLHPHAVAGQQSRGGPAGEDGQVGVERVQLGGEGLVAAGQIPQGAAGGDRRVGTVPWVLGGQLRDPLGGGQRVELGAEGVGGSDQQVAQLVGGLGAGP